MLLLLLYVFPFVKTFISTLFDTEKSDVPVPETVCLPGPVGLRGPQGVRGRNGRDGRDGHPGFDGFDGEGKRVITIHK